MTVATEASYAERVYTGVEATLVPGFSAQSDAAVLVSYLDGNGLPVDLTFGVHYSVTRDAAGAVTVNRIAFPSASAGSPVTLIIRRDTGAVQGTDFANLQRYDAGVMTTLFDRAFLVLGELKGRMTRAVAPFFVSNSVVDFRARRLKAADPVEDSDVATQGWVLLTTGIINLQNYVNQAAASAAAALASASSSLGYETGAQSARDKAQAWSNTPENANVPGTVEYSAFHWSRKAAANAAAVLAALAVTDYGFVADPPTATRDYGTVP